MKNKEDVGLVYFYFGYGRVEVGGMGIVVIYVNVGDDVFIWINFIFILRWVIIFRVMYMEDFFL